MLLLELRAVTSVGRRGGERAGVEREEGGERGGVKRGGMEREEGWREKRGGERAGVEREEG